MYNSGEEISGLDKLYTHIGKLIANARTGKKDPYPVGWDFGDIVWRKKSYIVVALDGYDIKFDPGNAMAIKQIGNGNKNYTFFDGNDDLYEMSNDPRKPDKVPIVYCLNHLRADENGRDWCPHEHQEVKFVFSHKPRNLPEKGGNLSDEGRNLLDGGGTGTNMGPPVPPPERKAGKNDEK
jgi:hypothetical protein